MLHNTNNLLNRIKSIRGHSIKYSPVKLLFTSVFALIFFPTVSIYSYAETSIGIAMHGQAKYKQGFKHFNYVNPDAPKGGKLKSAYVGSFNSMNPLISKGVPVYAVRTYIFESLLTRSFDEPFSLYGTSRGDHRSC